MNQRVIQAQSLVAATREQPRLAPFQTVALASRNARFLGVAVNDFAVAYAEVDGGHILEAMGADENDAIARLCTLATRAEGRS